MSKIPNAFKNGKAFIGFLTAGDPSVDKSVEYILAMEEAGCDLVELGIPFSDPMAEGFSIQEANLRALENNTTTDDVFEIVRKVRQKSDIPLVFLSYINPVFFYGYEEFFKKCGEYGVDGLIAPDLPYEEKGEIADFALKNDVDIISLIAPTSNQRIEMIAGDASGFIYLVSSFGVTGIRSEITTDLEPIVSQIKKACDLPVAVGFGIHTPKQAKEISQISDGVIVGSAIVNIIAEHGENASDALKEYVSDMKNACR
jgi:tryptophan synthase alpha chain